MERESSMTLSMTKDKIDIIKEHLSYNSASNDIFFLFIDDSPQSSALLHIASIFKSTKGVKVIDFSQFYSIITPLQSRNSKCILFIFNLLLPKDKEEGLLLLEYYSLHYISQQSKLIAIASLKGGLCQLVRIVQKEHIDTANVIFASLQNPASKLNNIEALYNYLMSFYQERYRYSVIWSLELCVDNKDGKVILIDENEDGSMPVKAHQSNENENGLAYHFDFIDSVDMFMQFGIQSADNGDSDCLSCLKKIVWCCSKEISLKEIVDTIEVPRDFLNKDVKEVNLVMRRSEKEEQLLSSFPSEKSKMVEIPIDANPLYLSFKLMQEEKKDYALHSNGSPKIHLFFYRNTQEISEYDSKNNLYTGHGPVLIHFKEQFPQREQNYVYVKIDNAQYKVTNPQRIKVLAQHLYNGIYLYNN